MPACKMEACSVRVFIAVVVGLFSNDIDAGTAAGNLRSEVK